MYVQHDYACVCMSARSAVLLHKVKSVAKNTVTMQEEKRGDQQINVARTLKQSIFLVISTHTH